MSYSNEQVRAHIAHLQGQNSGMVNVFPGVQIGVSRECPGDTADVLSETLLRAMRAEAELESVKAAMEDKTPWRMNDGISATYLDGCESRFTLTRGNDESQSRIVVFVAGDKAADAYALANAITCGGVVLQPVVGRDALHAAVQQQIDSIGAGGYAEQADHERRVVRPHLDCITDEIDALYDDAAKEAAKVQAENAERYEADFECRVLQHPEGWSAEDWCEFLERMPVPAGILRAQIIAPPGDELPEPVIDAVAEALGGDAYDCLRVWSAWGMGTMGREDFQAIADDGDRVADIARAAILAHIKGA